MAEMRKLHCSVVWTGQSQLWAVSVDDEVGSGQIAAPLTFRREGRIADLRCKREPSIPRGRKPTFRPPQTGLGAALSQVCSEPNVSIAAKYLDGC
jgi:hypothetical protein